MYAYIALHRSLTCLNIISRYIVIKQWNGDYSGCGRGQGLHESTV